MKQIKDLYLWSLIAAVLLLTVQVLAVIIYIYSFVPLVWDNSFWKDLEPNRDALFYIIFLTLSVGLMALGVKWFLPKLNSPDTRRKFKFWLALECVWCFLVVFCFFKWTTYRYPFWNVLAYENKTWLRAFFCAVCGLDLLSKIFFTEVENFYRRLQAKAGNASFPGWCIIALQAVFIGGIILLLYIPKPADVVALALVWDQWNHLDLVTGWFIKQGWYVNYEQTIQILVMAAIAYIIALFYFIRLWLNSWLLAATGALLAIKMGMFYYGASPCVWIKPANSFLAHAWDIALFFGFWFIASRYPKKFYTAAIVAGIVLVVGWFKAGGYLEALGLDNQPMMAPLRARQFFPFFMGYFVPLFYVFSLLVLMGKKNAQNIQGFRLPVVFCIYGLMIYINYIERSATGYYGSLMVPAIVVMLWWIKEALSTSPSTVKRGVYAGILLLAAGALLTNRLMLIYPDSIFQSNDRFASDRTSYASFGIIAPSAAMVRQLTREGEKVALLSNFETDVLIQAHRQSLFKDFPLMFSKFNNDPGQLSLKTRGQVLGLIKTTDEKNVPYVFVDLRIWALAPQALGNNGLERVLAYLHDHYQFHTQQGFLVALQRR